MMFLEYTLIGIAAGGIYGLVALGFVFIFLASGVFNFATGQMMMLGAYFFFAFSRLPGVGWPLAIVLAMAASIALASVVEWLVIRRLIGQPVIAAVMVTLGLGWMLQGTASLVWGQVPQQLPNILPRSPVAVGGILVPGRSLWGFAIAVVVALASVLFFRYSRTGVALRATASDQITAYSMGINVPASVRLTWIMAAIATTFAGIITGAINGLTPDLSNVAINVLAVVLLGGVNSIGGVILAGFIMGWVETMSGVYLGGKWREVIPYATVLIVLMLRPNGLFGSKPVERI